MVSFHMFNTWGADEEKKIKRTEILMKGLIPPRGDHNNNIEVAITSQLLWLK